MSEKQLVKHAVHWDMKDGSVHTTFIEMEINSVRILPRKTFEQTTLAELDEEAEAEDRTRRLEFLINMQVPERTMIERVPGFGLRDFLGHFCQKKFRERVLEALHAEAIADYQDAIANGNKTRANYIRKMINLWLLWAMFGGLLSWVAGKLSFKVGTSGE
jgi:hypothetical protein